VHILLIAGQPGQLFRNPHDAATAYSTATGLPINKGKAIALLSFPIEDFFTADQVVRSQS
jgi:hypothetical protein